MKIIFTILLVIHIICGSIGLFTGTLNLIRKKGDKPHRLVGKFFFYSMLINAIAGFCMSIMHNNQFLLIIAVFTLYLCGTGQRYLSLKGLDNGEKPKIIDWILTMGMILFALFFITFGIFQLYYNNSFGIVMIVFGSISFRLISQDILIYKGKIESKNFWLLLHLQRMMATYIAALTAFLVVNNTILPGIIAWLLPTVIIVPIIISWTRKYKVKLVK